MKRLLLVLIVFAVACGPSPTAPKKSPSPVATPVARPSLPPFPSPTAGGPMPPPPVAVVCSSQGPAGDQVALVSLRGVQGVVVRDVTDINHPVTRCSFQGGAYFRFVNSARVSYIVTSSGDLGASGALYMVDLNQSTTSLVRAWSSGGYGSWVYAWSPDGQKLTYLASDSTGVTWHLLSAAGDKTLALLGTTPARGVALDNDDIMVGFSADGQYVAVESTFSSLNPQGNHVVGILDTGGGPVAQATAEPRANPGFLTPTLVWYAGETRCTTTTPCGFGGPALTGNTYIYDIAGVESGSIDTAFYDSWPHNAGQI